MPGHWPAMPRGEMPLDAEAAQTAVAAQFDGWQNVLAARLEELAVAISTGRPEFFVEQVHWTRAALEARGVPAEMLRARLEALRHVLVEQIPAELDADGNWLYRPCSG